MGAALQATVLRRVLIRWRMLLREMCTVNARYRLFLCSRKNLKPITAVCNFAANIAI